MVHAYCFPHQSVYHYSGTWIWHFNNILFVVFFMAFLVHASTFAPFPAWRILLSLLIQENVIVLFIQDCVLFYISIVFNEYLCHRNYCILYITYVYSFLHTNNEKRDFLCLFCISLRGNLWLESDGTLGWCNK